MNKLLQQLEMAVPTAQVSTSSKISVKNVYDPELLYVECSVCARPVLWEAGRTTALLSQAGINPLTLDESCLILSDGCKECSHGGENFELSIVRLSSISLSSLLLMQQPKGHA